MIQPVFCHAADAGVVVGGLVVRQTVLQTQDRVQKHAVSANIQTAEVSSEEKSTRKTLLYNRWRCTVNHTKQWRLKLELLYLY